MAAAPLCLRNCTPWEDHAMPAAVVESRTGLTVVAFTRVTPAPIPASPRPHALDGEMDGSTWTDSFTVSTGRRYPVAFTKISDQKGDTPDDSEPVQVGIPDPFHTVGPGRYWHVPGGYSTVIGVTGAVDTMPLTAINRQGPPEALLAVSWATVAACLKA